MTVSREISGIYVFPGEPGIAIHFRAARLKFFFGSLCPLLEHSVKYEVF